jgi:ATP-dependent Clp protease ATP-binding subunit ClpA
MATFNNRIDKIMREAISITKANKHEYCTVEHLSLALLGDEEIDKIIQNVGGKSSLIESDLLKAINAHPSLDTFTDPKPTMKLGTIIQRSAAQSSITKKEFTPDLLLLSIL